MPRVRVFRDPVHVTIRFDRESDQERLALDLIGTPEVQRLRHIRQLGLANFVYHGVEHSRFSHTLGVVHLAKRFYESGAFNAGQPPDHEELAIVLAAAVLHDVGHAPFSHAMEKVLGVEHEKISVAVVRGDTAVHEILFKYGGDEFVDSIAGHITDSSDRRTVSLISSQLDADRADYLLRDGYYAGVPNAHYDLERILQMTHLDDRGLLFDVRAKQAIEGYFIARYHLYLQLYYHRTVRAAESMLRAIFERARDLQEAGGELGEIGPVKGLFRRKPDLELAARITDHEFWAAFSYWTQHSDKVLRDLATRLLNRKLFKVSEIRVKDYFDFGTEVLPKLQEIAEKAGFPAKYYVRRDSAKDSPYEVTDPLASTPELKSIRIRLSNGDVQALESDSAVVKALQLEAYLNRVCYPEEILKMSNPSSNDELASDDSLFALVSLFHHERIAQDPSKLRPAIFLAQSSCSRTPYSYRLAMGKVVSEELAADLGQLWANRLDRLSVTSVSVSTSRFAEQLESLFEEDQATLEAAATSIFFSVHDLGNPADRLNWFRELPEPVLTRASSVAARYGESSSE